MTVQEKTEPPRSLTRFTGRSLVGLAGVVAAGTLFGLMTALVRTQWEPLERLDHGAASTLNDAVNDSAPLLAVLRFITTLGGNSIVWWVVIVGVAGLLIRRRWRLAAYLAVTGVGALILDPTLKSVIGRLRPVVPHPVAHGLGNSFPSGHSLGSMVAYGSLLLVFLPAVPRRWRRPAVVAVALLVALIGFSRIALGVHYVSDVIGAWLLGIAWLGATTYAFEAWRRETGRPETPALREGLEPEAAEEVKPVPESRPHRAGAGLGQRAGTVVVGMVLIFGLLVGFGLLVSRYTNGNFLGDRVVPRWFEAHRTPDLNTVAALFSELGNTHWILAVGLVAGPLMIAWSRHWRPAVFLVVLMFGELSMFVAAAAVVHRPRPDVSRMEPHLPTSSFPSGHLAATICLYVAIFLLVRGRTRAAWGWLALVPAVVMPVMVALARLYRGMHHPTDELGSVLLAVCWLPLVWYVVRPDADARRAGADRTGRPRAPADAGPEPVTAG